MAKSKEGLISIYFSISDYQNSFINYYYAQLQFDLPTDIQQKIEAVENATKADVIEASKHLKLDTVAFINKED